LEKFVGQMLFGIQASQDVKLSNIPRSLKEEIPLIKVEDRLSRNLKAVALEAELAPQLAKIASQRISVNTVLCLDLSDIRKEYAKKMEVSGSGTGWQRGPSACRLLAMRYYRRGRKRY
jgi:hypothetical protein